MYYGITRDLVEKFVDLCPACAVTRPQTSKPVLTPNESNAFNEIGQVGI